MNVVSIDAPRLVGDVMATEAIVVPVDAALGDAARLLERHAISGLPVVDGEGALVLMLSGALRVRLTAMEHVLDPGDSIYFEGVQLKALECASSTEDVIWISVFTPAVF